MPPHVEAVQRVGGYGKVASGPSKLGVNEWRENGRQTRQAGSGADDEFTDAGFGINYVPHLRCWEFLLFSPSPDGLG